MLKQFPIVVDLKRDIRNNFFSVRVNTNDLETVELLITIQDNGAPLNISDTVVRIAIQKPDKKTVLQDCRITDGTAGKCNVILNNQAYIVPGEHKAELMIFEQNNEEVSVTYPFFYNARRGIMDNDTLESTNEYNSLQEAFEMAESLLGGGFGLIGDGGTEEDHTNGNDNIRAIDLRFDYRNNGGTINFGTKDYTSQASKTAVKFNVQNDGIFKVSGQITLSCSTDAEISIIPHLYQVESPDFPFSSTSIDERNAIIINAKANIEHILNFQTAIRCLDPTAGNGAKEVVFQIRTKISDGSGSIKFISALAEMIPATNKDSYQRIDINPPVVIYPAGLKYEF